MHRPRRETASRGRFTRDVLRPLTRTARPAAAPGHRPGRALDLRSAARSPELRERPGAARPRPHCLFETALGAAGDGAGSRYV